MGTLTQESRTYGQVRGVMPFSCAYLAADASPGDALVAAALAWRTEPPENDEVVLSLLEAGMVPLYLHYIDDQRARLVELGRHDLAEAFGQWRRRLLQ